MVRPDAAGFLVWCTTARGCCSVLLPSRIIQQYMTSVPNVAPSEPPSEACCSRFPQQLLVQFQRHLPAAHGSASPLMSNPAPVLTQLFGTRMGFVSILNPPCPASSFSPCLSLWVPFVAKDRFGVNKPGHHPAGAAVAGAAATVFHDAIMTPMDVVKQRLQLGHHKGMLDCMRTIRRTEGSKVCGRYFNYMRYDDSTVAAAEPQWTREFRGSAFA